MRSAFTAYTTGSGVMWGELVLLLAGMNVCCQCADDDAEF